MNTNIIKQDLALIMQGMNNNYSALQRKLRAYHPEILSAVINSWEDAKNQYGIDQDARSSFMEKVYWFYNEQSPVCHLGQRRRFMYFSTGYVCCKRDCECALSKRESSMLKNHGVSYPMQSEAVKNKAMDTWQQKYGTTKLSEINVDKKRQTCVDKFGTTTPLESVEIRKKTSDTYANRTGFLKPFNNTEVQHKIQEYWHSKTGKRSYSKTSQQISDNHIELLQERFPGHFNILLDPALLGNELRTKTRFQLSREIGCSNSLIAKRIMEWNLVEFQKTTSYYETMIEDFLLENSIEFEKNTRKVIPPKEIDFYLPKYRLGIEFHGLHWHGERFSKRDKQYHLGKLQAAQSNQVDLIQVFQDEWENHSETIKSLIKQKCGLVDQRIYARNCTIQTITAKVSGDFLDKNHLQSKSIGCFANYGLFHNTELLAVMTFKKSKHNIELSRFAVAPNTLVVGGASKLFKRFLMDHNPSEIISYSDKRMFTGKLYGLLGFEHTGDTVPGYWYFNSGYERKHRLNYTKKKLIKDGHDSTKTEWDIMQSIGYDRIWDCGHSRWIWKTKGEENGLQRS